MIDLKHFDPTDANAGMKAAERSNMLEQKILDGQKLLAEYVDNPNHLIDLPDNMITSFRRLVTETLNPDAERP